MQWYRLCLLYISNFSYILNTSQSSYNLQGYIFSTFSQSLCPLKIASVIYKKKINLVLYFSCAAPLFIVFIPVWEGGKYSYELFNIMIELLVGIAFLSCLFSTLTGVISINLLFFSIGILKSEILEVYLKKKDKVNHLSVILLRP